MDSRNEFISPAALKLLEDFHPSVFLSNDLQEQVTADITLESDALDQSYALFRSRSESRTREVSQNVDLCSPFPPSTSVSSEPTHKRAIFDPKRRAEVARVRRKGACMRCRLSKSPVSCHLLTIT